MIKVKKNCKRCYGFGITRSQDTILPNWEDLKVLGQSYKGGFDKRTKLRLCECVKFVCSSCNKVTSVKKWYSVVNEGNRVFYECACKKDGIEILVKETGIETKNWTKKPVD